MSFIEPPPSEASRPEHVVRYLSRYLSGGPISDSRITAADDKSVTFLAREGKTPGGEDVQVPVTLSRDEFVCRWCLHIQPSQLTKTRYFGGSSNQRRDAYLERCAIMLNADAIDPAGDGLHDTDDEPWTLERSESSGVLSGGDGSLLCPHCNEPLLWLMGEQRKPSWSEVLSRVSASCPAWYRLYLEQQERRWWDEKMGAGFSDWYDAHLETQVESAKAPHPPPPVQLNLSGIDLGRRFELESF